MGEPNDELARDAGHRKNFGGANAKLAAGRIADRAVCVVAAASYRTAKRRNPLRRLVYGADCRGRTVLSCRFRDEACAASAGSASWEFAGYYLHLLGHGDLRCVDVRSPCGACPRCSRTVAGLDDSKELHGR